MTNCLKFNIFKACSDDSEFEHLMLLFRFTIKEHDLLIYLINYLVFYLYICTVFYKVFIQIYKIWTKQEIKALT